MIEPAAFYAALQQNDLTFFTGVPDSLLKDLCAYIDDTADAANHVINANEGLAISHATGYHLATGRVPVVYMQNSGTGNAVNPLISLADPAVYGIPMLLLIGWRAEPGVHDEPQHTTQGRIQERLLQTLEIPYTIIGGSSHDYADVITGHARAMAAVPRPHALLIRRGTFAPYRAEAQAPGGRLSRFEAIRGIFETLESDDLVVSTTGMTSRELFELREQRGESHQTDFLTVGSMGHASQIALGIAMQLPDRTIICLDGDGAVLMHLGSMAIIGSRRPRNLIHIVVNNGAHDSVGGQPTVAREVDLCAIATACGYRSVSRIDSEEAVTPTITRARGGPRPAFVEFIVASSAHTDAGRPTTTPAENKVAFMDSIRDSR
jgi:phosphonopyruvate decarboxylase